jgi:hypothetical protein
MKHLVIAMLALGLAACQTAPGKGIDARGGVMASLGKGPLTPAALVGAAPSAISARLGEPDFRRAEPHAEIWQYTGGDCSLFVYFYETDGGALGSRYVDARKLEGGAASKDACLAAVMAKRNTPVS